jgi:predicted Zn-dependent protease
LNNQTKPAEALAALDKAMRLDPRNPDNYLYEQGWAYTDLERWQDAIPPLKRYSARYPDYLWAHALLAHDYGKAGDDDAAQAEAAEVERLVATDPNSAVGYSALASVLNSLGKPADALVAVDKSMRLDPRNRHKYLFDQGRAYIRMNAARS